jgi:hypothetical protein
MGKKFTMQASAQLQFCEDLQENGIAEEASEQQHSLDQIQSHQQLLRNC